MEDFNVIWSVETAMQLKTYHKNEKLCELPVMEREYEFYY